MDEQSDAESRNGSESPVDEESSSESPVDEESSSEPPVDGESDKRSTRTVTPPVRVPNRGFVRTVQESSRWVLGLPALLIAFLLVDLAGTVILLTEPLLLIGWAVLPFLVGGIAYHYANCRVRAEDVAGIRAFLSATASVFVVFGSLVTIAIVYALSVVAVPILVAGAVFAVDWAFAGVGIPFPYSIVLAIAFPLSFVPALYLAVRLSLAFPACVLDRQGTPESLAISWDASQGVAFKLLGIVCLQIIGVAGIWIVAVTVGGVDILLSPVVLVPLAPVHAVIMGTAQMALARVYLERRPADIGSRTVAHPMDTREPVTW